MNRKSITQSRPKGNELEFNSILNALASYYNKPANLVIQHLYDRFNYSYQDVAKILKTSKQNVSKRFPKEVTV